MNRRLPWAPVRVRMRRLRDRFHGELDESHRAFLDEELEQANYDLAIDILCDGLAMEGVTLALDEYRDIMAVARSLSLEKKGNIVAMTDLLARPEH